MSALVCDGPPKMQPLPTPPKSYEEFESRLIRALGATVGGECLTKALGYPSQDAFRKAHHRGRLPVVTFEVQGRRGRFASAADIAAWLWGKRTELAQSNTRGGAPLTP